MKDGSLGLILYGVAGATVALPVLDSLIRRRQRDATPKVMHARRVLFFASVVLTATAGGTYGVNPTALPHHLLLVCASVLATIMIITFIFAMVRKDRDVGDHSVSEHQAQPADH